MSVLTQKERDGLEDVFLSIHSTNEKYKKIKNLSALLLNKEVSINPLALLKRANSGLQLHKLSFIHTLFSKKKKNLSK